MLAIAASLLVAVESAADHLLVKYPATSSSFWETTFATSDILPVTVLAIAVSLAVAVELAAVHFSLKYSFALSSFSLTFAATSDILAFTLAAMAVSFPPVKLSMKVHEVMKCCFKASPVAAAIPFIPPPCVENAVCMAFILSFDVFSTTPQTALTVIPKSELFHAFFISVILLLTATAALVIRSLMPECISDIFALTLADISDSL